MKMAMSATTVERTAMAMVAGWDKVEPDEPEVLVSVLSVRPLPLSAPPSLGSGLGTWGVLGLVVGVVSGAFGIPVVGAPPAVLVSCLSYQRCQKMALSAG